MRSHQNVFRVLKFICPEHLYEELEGDLMEQYERDVSKYGERAAGRRLALHVLAFVRPEIIMRNRFSLNLSNNYMFQNYLKTTTRHIAKSKVNFAFKLGGLSLALFSFLIISIYVSFQLSFDNFHKDYKRIYRVNSEWKENGSIAQYAGVPGAVGPALKDHFPEVESFVQMFGTNRNIAKYKEKNLLLPELMVADSSIFDVFTIEFVKGDRHALSKPGSLILSESLARKVFGDEEPLGKSISFTERFNASFEVGAIIKDLPVNSHLEINGLLPPNSLLDSAELAQDSWAANMDLGGTMLFIKFKENSKVEGFAEKVNPFLRTKITKTQGNTQEDYGIFLQPLRDIYLAPKLYGEFYAWKGNAMYVYIFSILGIFLLVIASMNYINLSIADFRKRSKETGLRKILGARKGHVVALVAMESFFMCCVALLLSAGMLYLLFPQVSQLLDERLTFNMLFDSQTALIVVIALMLLIGLSTAYPAYHLSAGNAANDLKAQSGLGGGSSVGRSLLTVQFIISILCICATVIVGRQLQYMDTKDPGYDRHNLMVLYTPDRFPPEKIPVIKEELKRLPGVANVSYSTFRIAGAGYFREWYRVEQGGEMKPVMLNEVFFDHDFFDVTRIPLVAGRNFDAGNASDPHTAFIVNEAAVREFGWNDPIGKRIGFGYEEGKKGEKWEGTVIGVVKDFNVYSMHKKIEPLVMRLPWSDWPGQCIHVRIDGPVSSTIAAIKSKYEEVMPGFLLVYHLIDDLYSNQYKNERKAFDALQLVTWIIVLISSLGILSLSIFMSVCRMKEFGIRKVLGATVFQIASLHTRYFLRIVIVANLLAVPVSYFLMKEWLSGFAYQTDLHVLLLPAVVCSSMVIVILSASYSSLKAGRMNPVDVIKMRN